jgi:D-alanine transaminase
MPSRPAFAWFEGKVVPFADAKVPIDDRGLQFGESLYEVVAIAGGQPRLLAEHVARMEHALPALGLAGALPALTEWERFVAELLQREPVREGLLYAQLTGGAAPREHVPSVPPPPTFFAYVAPYRFPRAAQVSRGVTAISLLDPRWARRDLKTTMLLPAILAKREARRQGADEAVLFGADGFVHEGASSNVFGLADGVLFSPAQSEALLPGTMRPLVASVARDAGLAVRNEPVTLARLAVADEVFVTSSSQLVMPVLSLDGKPIGNGAAGPIARDLARRVRARFDIDDG